MATILPVVVVIDVQVPAELKLSQVIQAGDLLSLQFRRGERWQEHCSENGNDRDNHQQFDQSESGPRRLAGAGIAILHAVTD